MLYRFFPSRPVPMVYPREMTERIRRKSDRVRQCSKRGNRESGWEGAINTAKKSPYIDEMYEEALFNK